MPEFTDDWTSRNFPVWNHVLEGFDPANVLEVGSWEGRSAVYWLERFPRSHLTCIDAWDLDTAPIVEGFMYQMDAVARAELTFAQSVMCRYNGRVEKRKGRSTDELAKLCLQRARYDLVYLDAGHGAHEVYADLVLSWALLADGGILAVDDYRWDRSPSVGDHPGRGVQGFFRNLHADAYEVLDDSYQLIVRKSSPTHYQEYLEGKSTNQTLVMRIW